MINAVMSESFNTRLDTLTLADGSHVFDFSEAIGELSRG